MSLVQLTFPERDLKLQISPSTFRWPGAQFGAGLQHAHQPPNERSWVPRLQFCFEVARSLEESLNNMRWIISFKGIWPSDIRHCHRCCCSCCSCCDCGVTGSGFGSWHRSMTLCTKRRRNLDKPWPFTCSLQGTNMTTMAKGEIGWNWNKIYKASQQNCATNAFNRRLEAEIELQHLTSLPAFIIPGWVSTDSRSKATRFALRNQQTHPKFPDTGCIFFDVVQSFYNWRSLAVTAQPRSLSIASRRERSSRSKRRKRGVFIAEFVLILDHDSNRHKSTQLSGCHTEYGNVCLLLIIVLSRSK